MPGQQGTTSGRFEDLANAECRELLAAKGVGRIAFMAPNGPNVLPVNYVLHEGDILFRTSAYNVIASSVNGQRVAFEVDEFDDYLQGGWSVLVMGTASFVEDEDELPTQLSARPEPWAEGSRPLHVRISIASVTGRRVHPV